MTENPNIPPVEVPALQQPPGSRVTLEKYPEGLTLKIPPKGLVGGNLVTLILGLALSVLMIMFMFTAKADAGNLVPFAMFAAIGAVISLVGVHLSRRAAALAVIGPQLMAMRTGLFGSKSQEWDASQIAAIRVAPSGIEVNDEPVLELQIHAQDGAKFSLLAGCPEADLHWMADILRRQLGVAD